MKACILAVVICSFLISEHAFAGRPLITDDSYVVGKNQFQLETWFFEDKRSFQHWFIPTVGIGDSIEVSASGVHGISYIKDEAKKYSFAGPILQGKILVRDMGYDVWPSLGIAGGLIPSLGEGYFSSPSSEYYFYIAGTSYLLKNDLIVFHFNFGRQTRRQLDSHSYLLWGVAVEFKTHEKSHVFVEATNGDLYAFIPGNAAQGGLRYDINESFQVDGTIGTGFSGRPSLPLWATLGIKLVTDIF